MGRGIGPREIRASELDGEGVARITNSRVLLKGRRGSFCFYVLRITFYFFFFLAGFATAFVFAAAFCFPPSAFCFLSSSSFTNLTNLSTVHATEPPPASPKSVTSVNIKTVFVTSDLGEVAARLAEMIEVE